MREVNKDNFQEIVIDSKKPVMVDFWTEWCGPCKVLSPILEELSTEQSDFEIVSCNVDENAELTKRFAIRGIPTVLFFNNGEMVDKNVGMASKSLFEAKISSLK